MQATATDKSYTQGCYIEDYEVITEFFIFIQHMCKLPSVQSRLPWVSLIVGPGIT